MTSPRGFTRWAVAHSQALGLSFLVAAVVFWFFASFFPGQRQAAIGKWKRDLSALADARRDLLDRRILDETAQATFVATFPSVRALVSSAPHGSEGEGSVPHLRGILSDFRNVFGERSISIRNADGVAVAASDGPAAGVDAVALAREAIRSGEPRVDLVREPDGFIGFVIAAPVAGGSDLADAGAAGAVLVVGEAGEVFHLLDRPLVTGRSGEMLLVRRDRESILFLSPLLFRKDPPLTFRQPFETLDLAARAALAGKDTFSSYVDYRNVRILAATRRLTRAPWGLVVKVDEDEALAAFREDVRRRGLMWGAFLLALFAGAAGLWRSLVAAQQVALARSEARLEKAAEDRIRNLNRLLRTISDVSQIIVKATEEKPLLAEVCRIVVRRAGYVTAWIGRADLETKRVQLVALAGEGQAFLKSVEVRCDDSPLGRGPAGTAIREGRSVVVADALTDPSLEPWKEPLKSLGVGAIAAIPLRRGGIVTAAISVFAPAGATIEGENLALLEELAGDISYALDVLDDRERARKNEANVARLHAELEEALAWQRQIFEGSRDAVFVSDEEARFVAVNGAATELTGYSREELLAMGIPDLHEEPDLAAYHAFHQRILGGEQILSEAPIRKKDGSKVTVEFNNRLVTIGGRRFMHTAGRDVTERLQLEAQLRQAQKMEAVGRLAGGVAHDFNNLLTVIQGYAELLHASLANDPERKESLGEIVRAAERAAALTRQLLAFSRRQVLETRVLDLGEVVAGTEKMLRRLIGEDVEVVVVKPATLGRVKADPGQIEQVLLNLAVNSRDAMPGGGRLTVELADVNLEAPLTTSHDSIPSGRYVVVSVRDTGGGMDAETLGHLFEPFFTTKEKGKGTGLGLATVFGIVKQSGGYVDVASAPGTGTTFRVYLPRSDARSTSGVRPRVLSRSGSETVLLVEDEAAVRSLVQAVLERRGYAVLAACDGAAALDLVDKHAGVIHVLLTDVVMPGMNGCDLAVRVKERRPAIKVVFMSGYTADVPADFGMEGGPAFLPKPFNERTLTVKLREVLDAPSA